jgi:hypothetical protein
MRRTRGYAMAVHGQSVDRRPSHPAGRKEEFHGRTAALLQRLGPGSASLQLRGELDVGSLPMLDGALARVDRWAVSALLVDTGAVGFVELRVLGRLIEAHHGLERLGGGLLVIHPPQCLLRLLDLVEELELPVLR